MKTLRRYCADGVIPGACKPARHHWKLPDLTVENLVTAKRNLGQKRADASKKIWSAEPGSVELDSLRGGCIGIGSVSPRMRRKFESATPNRAKWKQADIYANAAALDLTKQQIVLSEVQVSEIRTAVAYALMSTKGDILSLTSEALPAEIRYAAPMRATLEAAQRRGVSLFKLVVAAQMISTRLRQGEHVDLTVENLYREWLKLCPRKVARGKPAWEFSGHPDEAGCARPNLGVIHIKTFRKRYGRIKIRDVMKFAKDEMHLHTVEPCSPDETNSDSYYVQEQLSDAEALDNHSDMEGDK